MKSQSSTHTTEILSSVQEKRMMNMSEQVKQVLLHIFLTIPHTIYITG